MDPSPEKDRNRPDAELIELAKKEDTDAWDTLVQRYETKVRKHLLSYLRNALVVERLTQQTFQRAQQALKTLRDVSKFKQWLYEIAEDQVSGEVVKLVLQGNKEAWDVLDQLHRDRDFVDALRKVLRSVSQTSAVSQALMKFADLEDILHVQGWMKIDPVYDERFDPRLHYVRTRRPDPHIAAPNRVLEVERPGYIRQRPRNTLNGLQIRPAVVDVSA